jgi:hypothetical protein
MKGLICHPTNGLGNRLRVMSSTYILSSELGSEFYLEWPSYSHFWKRPFKDPRLLTAGEKIATYKADRLPDMGKVSKSRAPYLRFSTGQSFTPPSMGLGKYNSLKSDFYNSLNPHDSILGPAQDFVSKFFKGNVLGIQFRGGDLLKNGICLGAVQSLPYIDPHIRDYDVIFVTTNDPSFINFLKPIYPDKEFVYFANPEEGSRDTSGSQGGAFWANKGRLKLMAQDLIEWYILAEVDLLIGSFASSFSYESLFINKRTKFIEIKNPAREMKAYWTRNTRDLVYL